MFKQVLILAGSVIAIAVTVASAAGDPTDKPAEPEAHVEKKAPPPSKPATTDESYYEDEDFVFGEPVTYDEEGKTEESEPPSEYKPVQERPAQMVQTAKPVVRPRTTPKKGEPGSRENPVEILPNIPPPTGKTVEAPQN